MINKKNEKIEGTIRFEGMLQGRFPNVDNFPGVLREWVALMEGMGVAIHADISDDGFTLLPDAEACSSRRLGDSPELAVQQAIEQLLSHYPGMDPAQLSSTLRSREYRPKEEVQTIYAVAGRTVKAQSRTLAAETTPPPPPLSTKQKIQMGLFGLGFAAALCGIAMLFPGVRAMIWSVRETVRPVNAEEIKIVAGPYDAYFTPKVDDQKSGWGILYLQLSRTDKYPKDDEKLKAAATAAGDDVRQRLALESVVKGYVRIEFFDPDDKLVASHDFRIKGLDAKAAETLSFPYPAGARIVKIVFVP